MKQLRVCKHCGRRIFLYKPSELWYSDYSNHNGFHCYRGMKQYHEPRSFIQYYEAIK